MQIAMAGCSIDHDPFAIGLAVQGAK